MAKKHAYKKGDTLVCILSASPGYKVDSEYVVFDDPKLGLCLKGGDGYVDPLTMLVSDFRKKDLKDVRED